jgi:Kef-type K+ transport system membrane component KefB
VLLGLFFITIGMLLDLVVLAREFLLVAGLWLAITVIKAGTMALIARGFGLNGFRALRTGIVLAAGGEFGVAILSILLQGRALPAGGQPCSSRWCSAWSRVR